MATDNRFGSTVDNWKFIHHSLSLKAVFYIPQLVSVCRDSGQKNDSTDLAFRQQAVDDLLQSCIRFVGISPVEVGANRR